MKHGSSTKPGNNGNHAEGRARALLSAFFHVKEGNTVLWTDDDFISPEDLAILDSEIPTIAGDENVVLTGPTGFIRRQVDESEQVILQKLEVFGGWVGSSTLSANHIQAVLNIGGGAAASRVKVLMDQVVVSDRLPLKWSHIKRWVCYKLITSFYRNVYSRVASKDRYKSKLTEFSRELQRTQNQMFEDLGLPVCYQPLPKPAAKYSLTAISCAVGGSDAGGTLDSGTWDEGNVSKMTGTNPNFTGDVDVVITYLCSQYYQSPINRGNGESHPSDRVTVTLAPNEVLSIDINSLNPSQGAQDPGTMALVIYTPLTATHWNLYIGRTGSKADGSPNPMYLQNVEGPIPITTKTYLMTNAPNFSGYGPGTGQYADRRFQFMRTLQRA